MNPGDIIRSDQIKVTLKRGESLNLGFEVFETDASACGPVVLGDAEILSGYNFVALGEVEGENLASPVIPVEVLPVFLGEGQEPAELVVKVTQAAVQRVFQPGSFESFTIQILAFRPGETREIASGRIKVKDSASGAGQ